MATSASQFILSRRVFVVVQIREVVFLHLRELCDTEKEKHPRLSWQLRTFFSLVTSPSFPSQGSTEPNSGSFPPRRGTGGARIPIRSLQTKCKGPVGGIHQHQEYSCQHPSTFSISTGHSEDIPDKLLDPRLGERALEGGVGSLAAVYSHQGGVTEPTHFHAILEVGKGTGL